MLTRTFIAIELSDATRTALARQIGQLSHALPNVRWADPAALHLTLAFLGWLEDEQVQAAIKAASVACSATPFQVEVSGLGYFGSSRAPRVIWAGVRGNIPALLALQDHLARELETRGFPREERPFSPHLTLARLKQPLEPAALAHLTTLLKSPSQARDTVTMLVDHISVMKSELMRPAARYTCMEELPLRSVG